MTSRVQNHIVSGSLLACMIVPAVTEVCRLQSAHSYFGMTAHFGVDRRTKLIHAVVATPANVADSTVLPELLHGQQTRVWGDQAYRGQRAVIREHAPGARDFTIGATATAVWSMRSSGRKTAPSPTCGPGSNMRSSNSITLPAKPALIAIVRIFLRPIYSQRSLPADRDRGFAE
jgi:Transposase DDE domain